MIQDMKLDDLIELQDAIVVGPRYAAQGWVELSVRRIFSPWLVELGGYESTCFEQHTMDPITEKEIKTVFDRIMIQESELEPGLAALNAEIERKSLENMFSRMNDSEDKFLTLKIDSCSTAEEVKQALYDLVNKAKRL